MKIVTYTEKLKELYSEDPYTQHLDFTINISLYLFDHISVPLTILQSILLLMPASVHFTPKL